MTKSKAWMVLFASLSAVAIGCGGSDTTSKFAGADAQKLDAKKGPGGKVDDRSMCDYKGKPDKEASEVAGPGAIQPNVRRVYQIVGTGEDQHKVLICREVDTNLDGIKDVVRRYNDKGESTFEEADSDYDGRIDTWITFAKGRLAEVKTDTNRDGKADETKYYVAGKLSRVVRDGNHDGKPDVWEIYREGKLERMGVDVDGDEHVDRWDHDTELRRRFEEAERRKEEEEARKKAEAAKKAAEPDDEDDDDADGPKSKRLQNKK